MFESPQRFEPGRWARAEPGSGGGFLSLAFGFGSRQCVGRRIAENEMQLLLLHVSYCRTTPDHTQTGSSQSKVTDSETDKRLRALDSILVSFPLK